MADINDFRSGDSDNNILRKILTRLAGAASGGAASVVTAQAASGALTNRSGTMAAGATSQQIAAANDSRKYFFFQNVSSENIWLNFGTAAAQAQPSVLVLPNGSFTMDGSFVSTEAINVISTTVGSAYTAKEG